jgi:hypothetical protein
MKLSIVASNVAIKPSTVKGYLTVDLEADTLYEILASVPEQAILDYARQIGKPADSGNYFNGGEL